MTIESRDDVESLRRAAGIVSRMLDALEPGTAAAEPDFAGTAGTRAPLPHLSQLRQPWRGPGAARGADRRHPALSQ